MPWKNRTFAPAKRNNPLTSMGVWDFVGEGANRESPVEEDRVHE